MNKSILCFGAGLLCLATLALADDNRCNFANKLSACPQDNLSRGAETDPIGNLLNRLT